MTDTHDEWRRFEGQTDPDFPENVCYHGISLEQECINCSIESQKLGCGGDRLVKIPVDITVNIVNSDPVLKTGYLLKTKNER
jgi:hypothetical protein